MDSHLSRDAVYRLSLLLFVTFGVLVAAFPSTIALGLLSVALFLLLIVQTNRMGLEAWQVVILLSLSGFVVLNYGFENLSAPIGPLRYIPIGEMLMAAAMAFAIYRHRGPALREVLQDPPVLCLLCLFCLSILHLVVDLPEYGVYALRDSTTTFEAFFLVLGMIWAVRDRNVELLAKWLLILFVLCALYSYTFPWAERLQDWSPASGPFHAVPLLGNYQDIAVYLLSGSLFCIWVAPAIVTWPRWILNLLAVGQLAALGLLQSRTMYVGIVLVLALLLIQRETKPMKQFFSTVATALAALALAIVLLSVAGLKIEGRLGTMDMASLTKEVKSIWPSSVESQELGHESDRKAWYGEVWNKTRSSPSHMLIGVGYGLPLIDFPSDTGQPIRQPHNSTLNVFGRLGLAGLAIWLVFLGIVLKRLWQAAKTQRVIAGAYSPFHLWLLAFAVLGLLDSVVQPYFEFSHSAVPYFFLLGVAMGLYKKEIGEWPRAIPARVSIFPDTERRNGIGILPW